MGNHLDVPRLGCSAVLKCVGAKLYPQNMSEVPTTVPAMYRDEDELDLAYVAAGELESVVSSLSWDLMTPPERRDLIAVLEQLSGYFRGIDHAKLERMDKLAAVEPGAVESGDEIIDVILADPHGMRPADARRIVEAVHRTIEGLEAARCGRRSRDERSGRGAAGTHSDPPACYVRPTVAVPMNYAARQ